MRLGDDELPRLARHGLPIVREEGRSALQLPCPRHTGSACAIYEDRPGVCAQYECRLLRAYQEGATTLEDAQLRVRRMHELLETIHAALAPTPAQSVFEAAESLFAGDDGLEWRRQHRALLLDMAELLASGRRDFGVGETSGHVDKATIP